MPETAKGRKIKAAMEKSYAKKGLSKKEADSIYYAAANKGTIKGVHVKRKRKAKE